MNLHYGPRWAWDQTRPEAISAHREMAESHKIFSAPQRNGQDSPAPARTLGRSAATHFRLGAEHLGRALSLFVRSLQTSPTSACHAGLSRRKWRCASVISKNPVAGDRQ